MKGRNPTSMDLEKMSRSVAIVTAYNQATEEDEFALFRELVDDEGEQLSEHLAQFAWLLLRTIEASNKVTREEVLQWYGMRFAEASAEKTQTER